MATIFCRSRPKCRGSRSIHIETPSPRNPIGVKGAGEGGTIPAAACVISAVEDALGPKGPFIPLHPVSPQQVVQWLEAMPVE